MTIDLLVPRPRIVVPKPPSYIRGDWRFSEGSGLVLGDQSRYRNKGTIANATWSTDRKPGCLSLDGTAYVDCGDGVSLDIRTAITLEAWVKLTTAISGDRQVIISRDDGTNRNYEIAINAVGKAAWFAVIGGSAKEIVGDTVLSDATWYHILGVYDGSNQYIYLNGVSDKTAIARTGAIDNDDVSLTLGAREDGLDRFLTGSIGGVRLLAIALSASEALSRYNATK